MAVSMRCFFRRSRPFGGRTSSRIKETFEISFPSSSPIVLGVHGARDLTEVAIGVAGMKAMHDYRGDAIRTDILCGSAIEAVADELACAAGLVCGKLARTPACIIRGFAYQPGRGNARI